MDWHVSRLINYITFFGHLQQIYEYFFGALRLWSGGEFSCILTDANISRHSFAGFLLIGPVLPPADHNQALIACIVGAGGENNQLVPIYGLI